MLSESAYIRAIAFFTLVMGLVVTIGAKISLNWQLTWTLLIGTFLGSIVAIAIFKMSDEPVLSFIGVSALSICLGLLIGPLLRHYKQGTVLQAVVITMAVMVVMSFLGIIFPVAFRGIGSYLMGGLVLLIVAQFGQIICIALGFAQAAHMPILNWVGIALFTGFVAYDWAEALDREHTWDNAIDASGGLILDAVNLLLRALGDADND